MYLGPNAWEQLKHLYFMQFLLLVGLFPYWNNIESKPNLALFPGSPPPFLFIVEARGEPGNEAKSN